MGGNCYVSSNWINWIVRRNFELHCGCIDLGVKISGMLYTELDEENQQNTYLKFNSSPLKSYRAPKGAPKGKDRLPTINFQGFSLAIKLRGCTLLKKRGG